MKAPTTTIVSALLFLASFQVHAQSFPTKPIKLLVGFSAGGATDLVARVLAQRMGEKLGQTVVVENRVGASGIIATEALAKSPADGYTLGACSTAAFTILPSLLPSVSYNPVRDFQPIAQVGIAPYILVASPRLKLKSVQDVIALAKTKKDGLTYASGGVGSSSHMAGELFAAAAGIKMVHIPYKGLAEAIADVISGRVDIAFDQEATAGANIQAGKLTAIAIAHATRSPTLPDVPTFAQAGVPLEAAQWVGVCAPAGTPQDRTAAIYRSIASAMQNTAVTTRFQQLGVQPSLLSPSEFKQAIDADRAKWKNLISKAHITLQ